MKKFVINLSIFAVFLCVFYVFTLVVWGRFMPAFLKPNLTNDRMSFSGYTFTRLKEIRQRDKADIIFLGSSHTYRGFDTRIFKHHGLNTFNLGSSSQTPLQTVMLLKRYLDKVKPRLVIYEVHPSAFYSDGVEASLDLIVNDKNDWYSYEMAFKVNDIKTYNLLIYSVCRDAFGWDEYYNEPLKMGKNTYIEGGFVTRKLNYYQPKPIARSYIRFSRKQMAAFRKCVHEIRKRDIELILIYAPITHNLYSSYRNNGYFDSEMEQYAPYYNFNKIMNLSDSLHFYDAEHLNQNGVSLFDNKLIETLQSVLLPFQKDR